MRQSFTTEDNTFGVQFHLKEMVHGYLDEAYIYSTVISAPGSSTSFLSQSRELRKKGEKRKRHAHTKKGKRPQPQAKEVEATSECNEDASIKHLMVSFILSFLFFHETPNFYRIRNWDSNEVRRSKRSRRLATSLRKRSMNF